MPEKTLMQLAEAKFPDLTEPEQHLIECVAAGNVWAPRTLEIYQHDPADGADWGPLFVLRADLIAWLCLDKQARNHVTDTGIQVLDARIEGTLNVDYADFGKPFVFEKCFFAGGLNCRGAQFKTLDLSGSHVGYVIADTMKVTGNVTLGRVADTMTETGSVLLGPRFTATREVQMMGASIGGDLACVGGRFLKEDGCALNAGRIKVTGSVFMRYGFIAKGEVSLLGAVIGGDLDCKGGTFENEGRTIENEKRDALLADQVKVAGSVIMREGCAFHGQVRLRQARVEGHFQWHGIKDVDKAELDLRTAKVGTVYIGKKQKGKDNYQDMPVDKECRLDGFTYDFIASEMATDSDWWIEFIGRQKLVERDGVREFVPQPYEQAAKILGEHGYVEAARDVLIAGECLRKESIRPWKALKVAASDGSRMRIGRFLSQSLQWLLWYRILGPIIGYGHRVAPIAWIGLAFILLGWGLFGWVGYPEHMVKLEYWANSELAIKANVTHPEFQAFVYSLERFAPLIDLEQANYWHPNEHTSWGNALRWYGWVHTMAGWMITTVLLGAFAGLIKK